MKQVTLRLITLFIGIILIIISLLLNDFGCLRFILCLLGIISLTISNSIERNNKKVFIPLFAILFTLFMISTDYLFVCMFKKVPIFSYSIVTNNNNKVYNAIGYRVWICNDATYTFKVDPLYKLGYYCATKDMESVDVNNILPILNNNFDAYKDSYIKITGRINKIISSSELTMQTYVKSDNAYDYADDITIDYTFNIPSSEVSKHNVNDEVTIAGKVDSKTGEDNKVTIKIIDASFMTVNNTSEDTSYNFDVNENIYCQYDKELWFETDDHIYYKSCIDDLNLTILNNQYNLMYALKNHLITLNELKDEASGYLTNSKDNSVLYNYNNFKLLICDSSYSKDVIIGKTTMSFDDGYCKNLEDNESLGV